MNKILFGFLNRQVQLVLALFLVLFSNCNCERVGESTYPIKQTDTNNSDSSEHELLGEWRKLIITDYLGNDILLGKDKILKEFQSVNIKGYQSYKLDNSGNIIEIQNPSNNYSSYTYDELNRMIKHDLKQHVPPETYTAYIYNYNDNDSLNGITEEIYKHNILVRSENINDRDLRNSSEVFNQLFRNHSKNDFYINLKKTEIVTYEENMIFCCGEMMTGKNKLTYYIDSSNIIDSLIIYNFQSKSKLNFKYEYR